MSEILLEIDRKLLEILDELKKANEKHQEMIDLKKYQFRKELGA